ncbi:sugar transporter ESL1-like [Contarinia nasturtii]|uniref:sugar transporter ESL1-like n=1 Tax=Contarinia nasturtii TaxID=265458 RepID=UPI0012D47EEC|nr:sugar transporter ESL1-like [Contarinia nasturtii]
MIPALTGIFNEHNRNEFLTITPAQASMVASLGFILKPIGSFISGLITDSLGRRPAMIFVNIPYAIGWYTLYQSSSLWHLYLGIAFLGLAVGLMEAAVVSYIGEISEPKYRGVFLGYTNICYSFAMFMTLFLNTLMPWRMVCPCCLAVPVVTAITMYFIPESPY